MVLLVEATGPELRALRRTLQGVYFRRTRVALLDKRGNTIANLTGSFQGGSVDVDAHQDVTRSARLTVLDPKHEYGFDADTYEGGALDLTRMVRVWWVTDGPLLDRPISVPVHTGPITLLRRDGPLVEIETQGKEVRGLTPSHKTLVIPKGSRKTDAIKIILRERMGETRLKAIPDLPARIPEKIVVGPKDLPWKIVQRLARSMSRQCFYNGAGVPQLRKKPHKVAWRFEAGPDGGNITSPISTQTDLRRVVNHVKVIGRTPKGKKNPVAARATADRSHPLSPWGLDPDSPVWLESEEQNEHLRSVKECQELADELLDDGLRLIGDVSFNAVPVPFLDPLDMIEVDGPFESARTRIERFTLPLGVGSDMAIGYNDPYAIHKRRKRR